MNYVSRHDWLTFGNFHLNLTEGILLELGSPIPLSPKEFETLRLLVERSPKLVTKEEFLAQVWPDTFVGESSLARNISVLRKALGEGVIETVAKRGYRFTALVQPDGLGIQTQRAIPVQQAAPGTAAEPPSRRSPGWRKWNILPLTLILGGLVFALFWLALVLTKTRPVPELHQRQLTTNVSDNLIISSAISPNGKYLAYSDGSGIHVQLVDSGETMNVGGPREEGAPAAWWIASWFKDSTRFLANLVTADGNESAWIMPVIGAEATKLRDAAFASSISPDGSQIAFTTGHTQNSMAVQDRTYAFLGDREVWAMRLDGSGARRLLSVSGNESVARVRWSPDGKYLAYLHLLSPSINGSAVSLELRSSNGGPASTLIHQIGLRDYVWVPNGDIVYALCSGDHPWLSSCNLFNLILSRGVWRRFKSRRLTNWSGFNLDSLSLTNDSQRIAFTRDSGRNFVEVAEVLPGPRLSNLRDLSHRDGDDEPMGWTMDGKEVVFRSDRYGAMGVYKQRLDSETATKLVDGAIVSAQPDPSGQWVLYQASADETREPVPLMRVPVTGGQPEQIMIARSYSVLNCGLQRSTFCAFGEPTENGKIIVIYKLDPLQGRGDELARFSVDPAFSYGWSLSPDGQQIAVFKGGTNELRFISSVNGGTRQVNVHGYSAFNTMDWSADGHGLFVGSPDTSGVTLLFIDLNGSARPLLHELGATEIWVRPAPDRRHVAMAATEWNRNVWLIDNFDRARD